MNRIILYWVLPLLLVEHSVTAECHQERLAGCQVDDGHARCESCCLSYIDKLTPCTTKITFSIRNTFPYPNAYYLVSLSSVNFSRFENLQELELNTNHTQHSHTTLDLTESQGLSSLTSIKVLRFRLYQENYGNIGTYNKFKYLRTLRTLRTLDLTGAKGIGLNHAKYAIGDESSIQEVILKNIQEIRTAGHIYANFRYSTFCV